MRRKSLNKKSLQQGGNTRKKTISRNIEQKPSNPDYADLIPSIKSAIEMGASVKELLFELIQQNIPDQDIKGALIESGIEESAVEDAQFEIQQDAMRQMQQQMQAAAAQKQEQQNPQQEQDPNLEQAKKGVETESKDPPPTLIDLLTDYNIDPDSKEGYELAKQLTLEAIENGNSIPQFSCKGGGCSAIASNAAREFGVYNNRADAWDLGNKNYPQWISSNYAEDLKNKQLAQRWLAGNKNADTNSERYKEFLATANKPLDHIPGWRYNLDEFQENAKAGNLVGLDRANGKSSIAYANNKTYPNNRGYEHSGFMMDDDYMIHGSKHDHGANSPYNGYYTIDDVNDGIALPGYGSYSPVETIGVDKVDDVWNSVQENDYINKLVDFFKSIEMPDTDFSLMPFAFGDEVKDPPEDPPEDPPTDNPKSFLSKGDYDAKMLAQGTAQNEALKSTYDSELGNYNTYLAEKEKYDADNSGYAGSLDAYNYQQSNPDMFPTRFGGMGWRSGLDKSFQDTSKYRPLDDQELNQFNELQKSQIDRNNKLSAGIEDYQKESFIPSTATYVPVDSTDGYKSQHFGSIYDKVQKPTAPGAAPTEVMKPTEPSYVDTRQYLNPQITPLPVKSAGTLSGTPTQGIIGEYEEDEIVAPTYNSWEGSRPQRFMGAKNPLRGGRRLSAGLTQKLSGYDSDAMNAEIESAESEGRRINFEGMGKGSASSGKFQKQYNEEYDAYEAALKQREDDQNYAQGMSQGMLNMFTGSNNNLVQNQDGDEIIPGAVSDNTSIVNPYLHYGSSEPFKKLSKSDFYSNIIKRITEESDTIEATDDVNPMDMYNSQGVTMQPIGMKKGGEPPSKAYLKNIAEILNKEGVHPYMLVVGDKELGIPKMVKSVDSLTSVLNKIPDSYYNDDDFMNTVGDTFVLLNNGNQYQNIEDGYYSQYGNSRQQAEANKKLEDQAYNNLGTTKKAEEAKEAKRIAAEEAGFAKEDAQYEKQRQINIANKKRQAEIDNMNFLQLATGAAGELYDEYIEQPLRSGIKTVADAPIDALQWVDKEVLKPSVDYAWENVINPGIDRALGEALPWAIDEAQELNDIYRRAVNFNEGQSYSSEDAPFYSGLFNNSKSGTTYNSSFDNAFNDAYNAGVEEFNWNGKRYNTAKEGEARKGNPNSATTQQALDKMAEYLDENFESTMIDGKTMKPSDRLFHMYGQGNSPYISGDMAKIFSMFNVADDSKNTIIDTDLTKAITESDNPEKLLKTYFEKGYDANDPTTWVPKSKYKIDPDEVEYQGDKKAYKADQVYQDDQGNWHKTASGRPSYDPTSNTIFLDKDLLNNPEQLLSAFIAEMSHVAQQQKVGTAQMTKDFVSKDGSFFDSDAFGQMRKNLKKVNTPFEPLNKILQPAANQILKNTVQNNIYGSGKTQDELIKSYKEGDPYYAEHAHKFYEDDAFDYLLGSKDKEGNLLQPNYVPKVGYDESGHFHYEGDGHGSHDWGKMKQSFGGEPKYQGGGLVGNISNLPGGTYGAKYRNPMASYLPMDLGMKGSGANFLANAIQSVPKLFSGKDRDGDGAMDGMFRDRQLKRNKKRDLKALEYDYYLEDQMGNRPNKGLSGYSQQDLYEAIRRGSGMDGVRNAEEMESDLGKFSRVDFDPETGEYGMILSDRDPSERLSKNKKVREAYMEQYEGMDSSMAEFLQRFKDNPEAKDKFLEMYKAREDGSTFGFSPNKGEAFTYGKGEKNPYLYNTMMGYNQYNPAWSEIKQKGVEPGEAKEIIQSPMLDPIMSNLITPFYKTGGGLAKAQDGIPWFAGQMADQAAYEQNQMAKQQYQKDLSQYFQSFNNPTGMPDGLVEFPTEPESVPPSDLQLMFAQGNIEQSMMSNMQEGKAAMLRNNQPESDFELKKKRKKGLYKEKLNKAKDKFGDISNKAVGFASDINSMFRDQRGRYAANQAMLEGTSVDAQGMQFPAELSRGRRDVNTGQEYDILMGNSPSGYDDGSQYAKRGGETYDLSPAMIAKLISAGADIEMK
ncbi:hypothetical protein N9926_00995 [Flavobacteriaceae bacterium]|nr:hypothetical protein [Flavobacteriaceae bacterium]